MRVLYVGMKMLRNEIEINMHLMLTGMQMSFTYCTALQSTLLSPLHLRYRLRHACFILSLFTVRSDSDHAARIGQQGLPEEPPDLKYFLFHLYLVASLGGLFPMAEKVQKSPACHDQKFHYFSSLFGLRYSL